ncbi:MAG: hypothetical protein KTR31_26075 [Myxococcales bacterium]|nr:hypothetical protein [Myxococcales bacterium]
MRRRVVVTLLGTLACGSSQKTAPEGAAAEAPVPQMPAEPTQAEPAPASEGPVPSPLLGTGTSNTYVRVLNAEHAEHGRIFRAADGGCYVQLPLPPLAEGERQLSFRPRPRQAVDCPPSMSHESWQTCAQGTVSATEEGDACLCSVTGNPPPPPRPLDCPSLEG